MFPPNRKKFFNTTQLNYLNLGITTFALALSSYLVHARSMPACPFCLTLRFLLIALIGLSLSVLFLFPTYRSSIYPTQLFGSLSGLLLSLRQFYFEQTAARIIACPKKVSNAFTTVTNWLYAGAPACQKTPMLGPVTFAGWACLVFCILSVITFQLYWRQNRRR